LAECDENLPAQLENFEQHFGHLRDKPIKILELGVFHGGSLLMWHEYFSSGLIVGLDRKPNPIKGLPERIRFYQGSQDDKTLLERIADECAPDGFDIVLDDASHIGQLARDSFRHLFQRHLKSRGIYVVEDWGTGYWDSWPDGKSYHFANKIPKRTLAERVLRKFGWAGQRETDPNFAVHNFGMVGFVKELVDEVAWPDITMPHRGNSDLHRRDSTVRKMTIYNGHAFIVKA
jgi:hypothetical protein